MLSHLSLHACSWPSLAPPRRVFYLFYHDVSREQRARLNTRVWREGREGENNEEEEEEEEEEENKEDGGGGTRGGGGGGTRGGRGGNNRDCTM